MGVDVIIFVYTHEFSRHKNRRGQLETPNIDLCPHKGERIFRRQHFKLFEHITAAYTSLTQHHLEIFLLLSILLYRGAGITGVLQHLPFPGFYRPELRSSQLPPNEPSLQSTSCYGKQHYPPLP